MKTLAGLFVGAVLFVALAVAAPATMVGVGVVGGMLAVAFVAVRVHVARSRNRREALQRETEKAIADLRAAGRIA